METASDPSWMAVTVLALVVAMVALAILHRGVQRSHSAPATRVAIIVDWSNVLKGGREAAAAARAGQAHEATQRTWTCQVDVWALMRRIKSEVERECKAASLAPPLFVSAVFCGSCSSDTGVLRTRLERACAKYLGLQSHQVHISLQRQTAAGEVRTHLTRGASTTAISHARDACLHTCAATPDLSHRCTRPAARCR